MAGLRDTSRCAGTSHGAHIDTSKPAPCCAHKKRRSWSNVGAAQQTLQWHHSWGPSTFCGSKQCRRRLLLPRQAALGSSAPGTSSPPLFRYPGEHAMNLSEYMVVLDKPIGLTLAPDPITGQIVVQHIKEGSPAARTEMIQVGDVVKMCSAVFGEDMWQAVDIRRIRWAINNRTSKIKLVLERSRRPHGEPTWYSKGQVGQASQERDTLQLPVSFNSSSQDDGWPMQDMMMLAASPGRPMLVAFHRTTTVMAGSVVQAPPRTGAAAVARAARLQTVREELTEARRELELDLSPGGGGGAVGVVGGAAGGGSSSTASSATAGPNSSSSNSATASTGGGSSSSSSSAAGTSNNTPAAGAANASSSVQGAGAGSASSAQASSMSNPSSSNNTSSGTTSTAAATAQQLPARRISQHAREKKVTPLLPWLLVTSSRLDTRDLTQIASTRGLSALLELGLCTVGGALAVRGSESLAFAGLTHLNGNSAAGGLVAPALVQAGYVPVGVGGGGGASLLGGGGGATGTLAVTTSNATGQARGPWLGTGTGSNQNAQQASTSGSTTNSSTNSDSSSGSNNSTGSTASSSSALPAQARQKLLIHAAASLQRLSLRRQHGSMHHAPPEACTVLLHCAEPGMEAQVACLLAAWLHWYGSMPLQEALLSAEIGLGVAVEQGMVEGATEALLHGAEERMSKVVLMWRYGGLSASVAGDVVGSWSHRVPLQRCTNPMGCKGAVARGNFYLELMGLRPGLYCYKYIVDGTWAVDPAAPKVLDASGNWNNVLEVPARPPCSTSRERLALARWHAAHCAWDNKMGLRF